MKILAIETSCDDTCCALLEADKGGFKILSNVVSSQIKTHAPYGGVVPSLAARDHVRNIIPCLRSALSLETHSHTSLQNDPFLVSSLAKGRNNIDLIAVTIGPGLAPSLLVGLAAAKALAYAWQKPLVAINHLEAHMFANWLVPIGSNSKETMLLRQDCRVAPHFLQKCGAPRNDRNIGFPVLGLLVSGGHTMLVLMRDHGQYQVLGQTRDDAAGEAFDKIARLLRLGYPGGPAIAAEAAKFKGQKPKLKIKLPRPMINTKDYDFSFSGLKTAVLYDFKKRPTKIRRSKKYIQEMSVEVQEAIVDVLVAKILRAAKDFRAKTVILAGGVAANQCLRQILSHVLKKTSINLVLPPGQFCTDNALMVAIAAFFKVKKQKLIFNKRQLEQIKIKPNLGLA